LIGRIVSHYEILEKLGAGGMGVVYKARDTKLDRIVALKFLASNLVESEHARDRFLQEARAISAMNHPNIAIVHEAAEVDGEPFLVLEYLAGGTLRNKIADLHAAGLRMPVGEALILAQQLAEGLAHAHRNQVLHRDIKPANLMFNTEGKLKITDFGLARFIDGPHITKAGMRVGTANYMSPEQAAGLQIDNRSDLFSAGAVMYEMLSGEPPFQAPEEFQIIEQILRTETPLDKLPPDVPESLRAVIGKLLDKDREQRYQKADDAVLDLRAVQRTLEGPTSPLATHPLPTLPRRRRLSRRAWWGAFAILPVFALAVFAWLRFFPDWSVPERKHIAVLQFENVGGDPANGAFCEGLVETVTSSLTQLEQFHNKLMVVPSSEVRRQSIHSAADAKRAFNVNLVITGSVERSEGMIRLHANLVDTQTFTQIASRSILSPLDQLNQLQDRVVREVAGLLKLPVQPPTFDLLAAGNTSSASAYDLYLKARGYLDRYDKAGNLDQAIDFLKTAIKRDAGYSLAFAALSEANWRKYSLTRDPAFLSEAETLGLRAIELNKQVPAAHVNLGAVFSTTGRYPDAEREYQAALALDPVSVAAFQGLADVYRLSARSEEAEAVYQKAIKLRPDDWLTQTMLGTFYYEQSRYAEAEAPFRRGTDLTPDNFLAWYNLGALHLTDGKYELAAAEFRKSLALKEGPGGYLGLAAVYAAQGRYRDAAKINEKALALGPNSFVTAGNLADAYRWTPELAANAPEMYRRAIENTDRALITNPKDTYALSMRAVYWAKLGDRRQALEDIGKVRALAPSDARFLFRTALIQELGRDREHALASLAEALRAGFSWEEISHEPELAALRRDPRFEKLVQSQRNKKTN
jgi:serine/threonine protein kinase/tetratricopeptide (TPR) repeat protein